MHPAQPLPKLQLTSPIGYNKIEIFKGLSTANHCAAIVSGFSLVVPFAKAATASNPSLYALGNVLDKMKNKNFILFILTNKITAREKITYIVYL